MPFTGAEFWQDFSLGNVPQELFCTTHLHQTSPKGLDVRSGDLTTNKFVEIFLQKHFWLFNRNPLICPFSEEGFKSVYSSHSYRMVENKLTSVNWCLFVCVESESVDSIFISRYISRSNKDSFIIFHYWFIPGELSLLEDMDHSLNTSVCCYGLFNEHHVQHMRKGSLCQLPWTPLSKVPHTNSKN